MTEILKNSGLPIVLDKETNLLAFENDLKCEGYGRKESREMLNLLMDTNNIDEHDVVYDVYRKILFEKDKDQLEKDNYRYDITVVMPGTINGEAKKTSGHYHGFNPQRTSTYPEVYEVIKGTAIYILQKAMNFEGNPDELTIDDVIVVRVEEGQTIIVPPNYAHCSINASDEPFVFSNLAYVDCPIHYDAVKHFQGMAVYVKKNDEGLEFVTNNKYHKLPQIRFAKVKENPNLGIEFGKPVYDSYVENPRLFYFLGNVDEYTDEIMSMLEFVDMEDVK